VGVYKIDINGILWEITRDSLSLLLAYDYSNWNGEPERRMG